MDTLFTANELAQIYGVKPGTIHYWISVDHIEGATYSGRRKHYPIGEIQKAYDKRHPAKELQPTA